jgi:alkylglycerol monooxygenase
LVDFLGIEIFRVEWWALFVIVELGYYWFHRFAHEWNAGWGGHIVHHTSEEYNFSTALRQSSLQIFFSQCFYLPYAFIVPIPLFFYHKEWNVVYQFFIHTRYCPKLWYPIELIFNTPSHHRVHHGRNWKVFLYFFQTKVCGQELWWNIDHLR